MNTSTCRAAAIALLLLGCSSERVERAAEDVTEEVDQGFDAMREENRRRIREIAESSREMEADRQRTLERARERALERRE